MTDTARPTASEVMKAPARAVQLIDMVFPGDTNHHATLFGGHAALAGHHGHGRVRPDRLHFADR